MGSFSMYLQGISNKSKCLWSWQGTLWKMGPKKRRLAPCGGYKVEVRSSSVSKLWHNCSIKKCDRRGMIWICSYKWSVAMKNLKDALILHGKSDQRNAKKENFPKRLWKWWNRNLDEVGSNQCSERQWRY